MTASPDRRSLIGLDALNVTMADVRDGLGPYLSVYLKSERHWAPGAIGLAMAASSLSAVVCQVPAGMLVDGTRAKRLLVAVAGVLVALGCVSIIAWPGLGVVVASQVVLGAASAVIPPALAALSLGLVGRRLLPARISRNEAFNHGGNLLAALLAGTLGQMLGYRWIFYLVCGFAAVSALAVLLIDPRKIDHEAARGGEAQGADGTARPMGLRDLMRQRGLMVFLGCVLLFHFGNAAMLPLAGQVVAQAHPGQDAAALSACIIAAQLVMVGVACAVGRAMRGGMGRKPIFLLAFAVLPVRGLLFTVVSSPVGIVLVQVLDGVAAGIFGVVSVVIAAELMRGTGRFNLAQGLTGLAVGLGASLSQVVGGWVVQGFGYAAGFLVLAAIAAVGCACYALFMPETASPDEPAETVARPVPALS